jgi:hypothetical protein
MRGAKYYGNPPSLLEICPADVKSRRGGQPAPAPRVDSARSQSTVQVNVPLVDSQMPQRSRLKFV